VGAGEVVRLYDNGAVCSDGFVAGTKRTLLPQRPRAA
jgi:hypothetical protein